MAELDSSGYTFTSAPTKSETERFEYVAFDYLEYNPGLKGNKYDSYIGVYFSDTGERSD